MPYTIIRRGESRSFPDDDPFHAAAVQAQDAEVVLYLGSAALFSPHPDKKAVLIELGTECLAAHVPEADGARFDNLVGFARYRNGSDPPSALVEVVRQLETLESAVAAAVAVFESAGLSVSVCSDQPGRIIDRLVRPFYNAALRLIDEQRATQHDLDLTCRLGLGYPDGPVERVLRGGLAYHHDVTKALFETFGTAAYAPAPRAIATAARRDRRS
jgi:3-hydroxybutyryl-CoA dehydrogenase